MKNFSPEGKILLPKSSDEDETSDNEVIENETNDSEIEMNNYYSDDDDDNCDFQAEISRFYSGDSSDSDSAPETFSFSAAEENKKQAQKVFAEAIRQQKADLKRKRKEILQKNLNQKEEKRKKIEGVKPIDQDDVVELLEDKTDIVQEILRKPEEEIIANAANITFKCKVLPVEAKKPKFIPEKVEHFKDRLLYGGRIRREKNNREAILKREKQRIKR